MGMKLAGLSVGAMIGLAIGVLSWTGLAFLRVIPPRTGFYAWTLAMGAFGGWIGRKGGPVTRWTGGMAALFGAVGFACGFFGPLLLTPDSNMGPLLGIFLTGPWGAIVGAVVGLELGLIRQRWATQAAGCRPTTWQGPRA